MTDFKFNIGDVVRHAATGGRECFDERRMFVIGRHVEECPGGVQRKYTVRGISTNGAMSVDVFLVHEIELVSSEPFQCE